MPAKESSFVEKAREMLSLLPNANPTNLAIVSFVLAVLCIAILVLLNRRRAISRGNAVLLVGPPDAGKTAILSALVYNQTLPTHTSLQTSSSIFSLDGRKTLRIVDVPGHPRVRDQFQEHLPSAKAILFVVDASTVSRNGPAVAEHLHHILYALTSLPPSQPLPALLILAHKSDLLKSTSVASTATAGSDSLAVTRVKTVLERELEKRRTSQLGGVGVEGLGEEGERSDMGGLECSGPASGVFKFAEWEGGDITFVGTSVRVGKDSGLDEKSDDGLSPLREWLGDLP
ncbi:hypothetical protein PLICRDRAFT_161165 [Plicaturopsis crispa FD-325 SS-3]|nr:hypothetical protein PLICRDRAFT_161165 [Plicaturopsis crispa FD-325 SS-3]